MDKHSFTFDQLRPGQGSNEQPYLRILIFLTKHPDVSDEKFHDWWKTVHADLTMTGPGWGVHVTRYVQFHQTPAHKEALKAVGLEPLPYDGMGEMHAPSLEAWFKFSSSPGFQEKLLHDGANFMAGGIPKLMIGHDNLIYGAKIETSGGSDGILPTDSRLTKES